MSHYSTFDYNATTKRIRNLRFGEDTNLEEFLDIQEQLDRNKVRYVFDKNFDIKII